GGTLSIGSTGFDTTARRDPQLGVVTETAAEANGVVLSAKKAGEVSVSKAVARAVTTAHGRPGTTSVLWSRLLEGVVVRNASGKVVYERDRCTTVLRQTEGRVRSNSTGDCSGMARAVD